MSANDKKVRNLIEKHELGDLSDVQYNFLIQNLGVTQKQIDRINQQIDMDKIILSAICFAVLFGVGVLAQNFYPYFSS